MTIILAILVFTFLIFIHELGHFVAAKLNGVRVDEFALGMGPKLFGIKKGETLYSIRMVPIGGFCSMAGEDEESNDTRGFSAKKPWQRLTITIAGAAMNFIFAALILSFSFGASTIIGEVRAGFPAQTAGIMQGDNIVRIGDTKIEEWAQIREAVIANADTQVEVEVIRKGESKLLQMTPVLDKDTNELLLGIVSKPKMEGFNIVKGFKNTVATAGGMLVLLKDMITQKPIEGDVVGPVGIAIYLSNAAKSGFLQVLSLAAIISLNLGVVNMLPLPALDGGRSLMILIEIIRGKRVDPEKEGMVHFAGLMVLLALSVFIIFRDLIKFNVFG